MFRPNKSPEPCMGDPIPKPFVEIAPTPCRAIIMSSLQASEIFGLLVTRASLRSARAITGRAFSPQGRLLCRRQLGRRRLLKLTSHFPRAASPFRKGRRPAMLKPGLTDGRPGYVAPPQISRALYGRHKRCPTIELNWKRTDMSALQASGKFCCDLYPGLPAVSPGYNRTGFQP